MLWIGITTIANKTGECAGFFEFDITFDNSSAGLVVTVTLILWSSKDDY